MDYTVHGILQARILEWVAFPFSRRSFQPTDFFKKKKIRNPYYLVLDLSDKGLCVDLY